MADTSFLSKSAQTTVAVVVAMVSLLYIGWRSKTALDAQAAQPGLETKIDKIDQRTHDMATDIAVIKTKVDALEKRR